jgi:DNA-binding XRE family transcriptional regulator
MTRHFSVKLSWNGRKARHDKRLLFDFVLLRPHLQEVTYAILDGENPVRVWREYRGLTQQQVAEKAGISKPYLSQLEMGQRKGATEVLSAVARALDLSLEDLVAEEGKT